MGTLARHAISIRPLSRFRWFQLALIICCFATAALRSTAAQSDLAAQSQVNVSLALVGEVVTWRISVTNLGPTGASNVILTNACSTNAQFFFSSSSQGSCMSFDGGVLCNLGSLAAGTAAVVTLKLTPVSPGTVSLTTRVSSANPDPLPTNNIGQIQFIATPRTFQPGPNLVIARRNHAATLLDDGRVLIVGGGNATGHTATAELFDPSLGSFRLTGTMQTTRDYPTATLLTNGKVLVIGGERAEIFNPVTETFTDAGPTIKSRWAHTATSLQDGRVLITGGADPLDTYWSPAAEIYHPGSNGFFRVGDMVHGRYHHSATRLANGRVLIAGGSGAANWAEIYNPSSNSFAATGDMVAGNWWPTLTLLPGGKVLVAKPYGPAPNSELYDPVAGTFTGLADPSRPIKAETATLLSDGQVLVCPGLAGELYDPVTQRFTDTIPMTRSRTGFTATRLQDGRVLIVGGDETTEFYVPGEVKMLPQISILDAISAEGNAGAGTVEFPLQLSYPMAMPVQVEYFLSAGSADWLTGDIDYTNAFAIFPPGAINISINVSIRGDLNFEMDESFTIYLRSPSNAILSRAQATGTILNDDPIPTASVSDAQFNERAAIFTVPVPVILSGASIHPVTVRFSTADGTALASADYSSKQGELSFPPGVTTQFVHVPIRGDLAIEPDETFFLTLTSASNATISQAQAAVTLINDDGRPGQLDHFEFAPISPTQYPGRALAVEVSARDYLGNPVTNFHQRVEFRASSPDAASYEFDFESEGLEGWTPLLMGSSPGPYEITYFDVSGDGVPSAAFRLTPDYDSPPDGLTRSVYLRGGFSYLVSSELALRNDSDFPNYVEAAAELHIGQALIGSVNLTGFPPVPGSVPELPPGYTYHTSISGSFTTTTNGYYPIEVSFSGFGGDNRFWVYADNIRVQFPPLTLSKTNWFTNGVWAGEILFTNLAAGVTLEVIDAEGHSGTSVPFNLQPQTDLSVSSSVSAQVPHVGYPVTFTVAVTNHGPLTAPDIRLTNVLDGRVVILSATSALGACSVQSNIVSCQLGVLTNAGRAAVTVVASSPSTGWITNTAFVSSSLPDAFPDNNTSAQPQIINPAPIYMTSTTVTEPDTGTTNAAVTVFLEHPSAEWIAVDYSTIPGTALSAVDFLPATGRITFPPGVTTQFVTVQILGDTIDEANESFLVGISNPTNAVIANSGTGGITIADNDPPPVLSIADATVLEGNTGTAQAIFTASLSAPSSKTVQAYWATSDGTALFGSDYSSVPVTAPNAFVLVTFPPGTTNQSLSVTIKSDTLNESNETFHVTLSIPVNATLGRAAALGTILNDDGKPGEIDHFEWSRLNGPIFANQPVAVDIMARDAAGGMATNFSGPLNLNVKSGTTPGFNLNFESATLEPWIPLNSGRSPGPYRLMDFDVTGNGVSSRAFMFEPDYLSGDGIRQPLSLQGQVRYRFDLDVAVAVALVPQSARALYAQIRIGNQIIASAQWQAFLRGHLAGTFTPPTNGIYPVEIVAWHNLAGRAFPLYFDNFKIDQENPPMPVLATSYGILSNGLWQGTIRLAGTGTNILLEATDSEGHAGHSTPFLIRADTDTDGDGLPDAWELDYFPALDSASSAALADPDADGLSNAGEFRIGTNPIDAASAPRLLAAFRQPDIELQFATVPGHRYAVEWSTRPDGPWTALSTARLGSGEPVHLLDPSVPLGPARYYRLVIGP